MKRALIIFLSVLLALSASACGSAVMSPSDNIAEAAASHEDSNQENSNQESEPIRTAFVKDELSLSRDGMKIYGELYLPETEGILPLVILFHGFGATHSVVADYAESFAENGIAAYVYDFIGGSTSSRSDGKTTEMSVLTEAADLSAVLDHFLQDERFDSEKIFLMGESQGGFVSTYVAGTRPSDVAGLVALYPAYVLQDDARERTPDINNIPEAMNLMGTTIGSIYNRDALSFDIYDVMQNFPGDVLIIHGTADSIAPISYSERAEKVFPNASLKRIDGADHGFYGTALNTAANEALSFVQQLLTTTGTDAGESQSAIQISTDSDEAKTEMRMKIGETDVFVEWEENESVEALRELVKDQPLTIQMSMYSTFEQVGSLGVSLPRNDVQTTTQAGDIVLYSGSQIVVFYGSNSWAYTRLGRITDKTADEMKALLGNGDISIIINLE